VTRSEKRIWLAAAHARSCACQCPTARSPWPRRQDLLVGTLSPAVGELMDMEPSPTAGNHASPICSSAAPVRAASAFGMLAPSGSQAERPGCLGASSALPRLVGEWRFYQRSTQVLLSAGAVPSGGGRRCCYFLRPFL
jgi:hypothetical protein